MSENELIRVRKLSRSYDMDAETIQALRGVDISIRLNEYVAIMGVFASLHEQGQTVIMVTHEADIARHAKRVITSDTLQEAA